MEKIWKMYFFSVVRLLYVYNTIVYWLLFTILLIPAETCKTINVIMFEILHVRVLLLSCVCTDWSKLKRIYKILKKNISYKLTQYYFQFFVFNLVSFIPRILSANVAETSEITITSAVYILINSSWFECIWNSWWHLSKPQLLTLWYLIL